MNSTCPMDSMAFPRLLPWFRAHWGPPAAFAPLAWCGRPWRRGSGVPRMPWEASGGAKPYSSVVHIKIAGNYHYNQNRCECGWKPIIINVSGNYGRENPTNIDNNRFSHTLIYHSHDDNMSFFSSNRPCFPNKLCYKDLVFSVWSEVISYPYAPCMVYLPTCW